MGGKGYKEQERGQEAFVSLLMQAGHRVRVFFSSQPARAREVAGSRRVWASRQASAHSRAGAGMAEAVGTPTGAAIAGQSADSRLGMRAALWMCTCAARLIGG